LSHTPPVESAPVAPVTDSSPVAVSTMRPAPTGSPWASRSIPRRSCPK